MKGKKKVLSVVLKKSCRMILKRELSEGGRKDLSQISLWVPPNSKLVTIKTSTYGPWITMIKKTKSIPEKSSFQKV